MAMPDSQSRVLQGWRGSANAGVPYLVVLGLWLIAALLLFGDVLSIRPAAAQSFCGDRAEVMERSTAMDLRFGEGTVVQTSVHRVPVILWRTAQADVMVMTRDLTEFLFDALLDVGRAVGLRPGGLAEFEVRL